MFKQHDKVRFGDMKGVVVTTNSGKEGVPLQALFPAQKIVLGFRDTGDFFAFDGGPKLELIKPNIFKKGLEYVNNVLRRKSPMGDDQPKN